MEKDFFCLFIYTAIFVLSYMFTFLPKLQWLSGYGDFYSFSFFLVFQRYYNKVLSLKFCTCQFILQSKLLHFDLESFVRDTAQKMKFSITDFCSKYGQIRSFLRIWSHLLKKSVMENFIFCVVRVLLAKYIELRLKTWTMLSFYEFWLSKKHPTEQLFVDVFLVSLLFALNRYFPTGMYC